MELSTAGGTDLMESQRRFGAGTGLPDHNRKSDLDRDHAPDLDPDLDPDGRYARLLVEVLTEGLAELGSRAQLS